MGFRVAPVVLIKPGSGNGSSGGVRAWWRNLSSANNSRPSILGKPYFKTIYMGSTCVGLALVHRSSEVEPVDYEAVTGGGALHPPLNVTDS